MVLTEITPYSEVRSVLGISAKELRDEVLASNIYLTQLLEDIRALHPSMLSDFETVSELAVKSEAQERFVYLLQTYAAYTVASQCLGAMEMFAPQRITDGKAEMQRIVDPYAQLKKDVPAVRNTLRVKLRAAYAAVNPAATPPTATERLWALAATPANPITG